MRRSVALALAACALLSTPTARAHRIDEYLQAALLSLEPGSVSLTLRLAPGIAVSSAVISAIDRNADGILSPAEQAAYAGNVTSDLELTENGHPLTLHVAGLSFPTIPQMRAGVGEITITLKAGLPDAGGVRQLRFVNHHQRAISVYLVNALVPQDSRLTIESQDRSRDQSVYQVTFTQSPSYRSASPPNHLSGFAGAFRLGMRHIADGTDHLLFLLTLLLPAPLFALHARWRGTATVRRSLVHIVAIVSAFTLGHSLTLALSAFGLVQLPGRPVEVLIAVSILVSAVHALRPLFPGKEALIAGFFGLIHGLAFASALNELGMTGWYRLVSLLGFNLGIECMQMLVVLMTLPSLLLLSRTRGYPPFRLAGGCLAACASLAWIAERVTDRPNGFASIVERLARHGVALAAALLLCSIAAWYLERKPRPSIAGSSNSRNRPACTASTGLDARYTQIKGQ